MKKLRKILEILKLKWLRETTLTILLIAIIIAIFVGINIGVNAWDPQDIDLTKEKLYTLTDESKTEVSKIPDTDKIKIYLFDVEENTSIVDLTKQYARVNENIEVSVVSTSERLDLVSKYEVAKNSNSILIVCGDKHKLLTYYDLFTYDYNTGNSIDITEQRLTNSIIAVSSIGEATPIYILTGHGEYTKETQLMSMNTYLELENYVLKSLDLLVSEKIPDDCSTLIISTPNKDFTEVEAEKIKEYINRGGNILWMNDTLIAQEDFPNINKILDMYGVAIEKDGIVIEQDPSKMVMQTPDLILPIIENSTLVGDLAQEGTVMLLDTGKLKFVDSDKLSELGVVKTDILTTGEKSFYRRDLSIPNAAPVEGEEIGKQVVGALLEKTIEEEKISKLVIYANNLFATDQQIPIGQQIISAVYFYNNLDLVLNSVAYVSEKEDAITVRKNVETTYYTATETQDKVIKAIIFGLPVLIVLVGIVVWQLRRRKK
ncbi:MAG: GldG family protein [Clostridia bacterium]|nr:GldG family protein [Clostridia bacterium]